MDKAIIRSISEAIYSLFVINTQAAAIQQKNGAYLTKYIPLTPQLIERMILSRGSMGCYQQEYRAGHIKWICFDFDCVEKESPDLGELCAEVIRPMTRLLDELRIAYLTEFSGRRGVHVWILFDTILSKKSGYQILREIYRLLQERIGPLDASKWNLDKFPATDAHKGNIVGKQVKFPLSCHKSGGMSYFFEHGEIEKDGIGSDAFFAEQLRILEEYRPNSAADVMETLGLGAEAAAREFRYRYRTYRVFGNVEITTGQARDILSQTSVYREIFRRMQNGRARPEDWTVLLGTLAHCDPDAALLRDVLREFPNYDEEKTEANLSKLKDKYYPATFGYLYELYDLPPDEGLDLDETGFRYLLRALGLEPLIEEMPAALSERTTVNSVEDTVTKEKKYLLYNDEAPDVGIWNQLCLFNRLDYEALERQIEEIRNGGAGSRGIPAYRVFLRLESGEKTRRLVSLSARDRVVTTNLALQLCLRLRSRWKSYSYRPWLTSREEIFYAWYYAWGRYIKQIKAFLEVPFFDDYQVLFIDLRSFYDHIDFLTVFRSFEQSLDEEADNIFRYLLSFNDSLMRSLHDGERIGVPQGPAYARIIAELYLDRVLDEILPNPEESGIHLYRYVDDITIFCEPGVDGKGLFRRLSTALLSYGLPVNSAKSRYYGEVGSLTAEDANALLHSDDFNYDLQENRYTGALSRLDRGRRLQRYLNDHLFDMGSLGYIFGSHTITEAQRRCFRAYRREIFSSRIGRGSNFRKFYRFLFRNEEYLDVVLDARELDLIPTDSLNFSNFICQLYLSRQSGEIADGLFRRVCREYLFTLDTDGMAGQDAVVLKAFEMLICD